MDFRACQEEARTTTLGDIHICRANRRDLGWLLLVGLVDLQELDLCVFLLSKAVLEMG